MVKRRMIPLARQLARTARALVAANQPELVQVRMVA
jgi:hypothetical protein